jgi:mycoredoxin
MVAVSRTFPLCEHPSPNVEWSAKEMLGTVTMYSTTWCGYCRRLKSQLDREGIAYTEINIEQDPESAAFVEKANGGNQTVPTVLFPDGTTLTNPSLAQVKQKIGV